MGMDFPPPHPVQFQGSGLARVLLRALGWRVDFEGLPTQQGVIVVYPHTSNWDFPIAVLLKWAVGIPVQFWSKDTLFRIPLFGWWLRWVGGVPIRRSAPQGVVGQMTELMKQKKAGGQYFWLALSPEGTRRLTAGWRSGFYRLALQADVPVGLAGLDYSRKRLVFRDFVRLSGDEQRDLERMAVAMREFHGLRPHAAAPVRLINSGRPRADTIVK
ncbi:MAG: 1-acyl-sn-glycerol-3-phosphate acyltransferase [Polaromonas sp.]|uniref:1-acyl-sn-glycerol-3-phosphate acyltransferase n=1 Tax=Polaromonas sp. TaxID=1869339 RepID=UPI0027358352|nr:1-acyl-sn-glycerol-3-phosphate acyltransferase [Polaromonas sp.]MDP2817105.1 1-acyl-sn-glycerol-3-phosphate acyltransferase [Polaromonas sp.]